MSGYTFIYALCEPSTNEIRYIGKADDPEKRYKRHYSITELRPNTHKANWLKSLLKQGMMAVLLILEQVSSSDWQSAERRWISEMRDKGARLTNSTIGGDGITGLKHSNDARAKISDALRKRVRKKSSYDKVSQKLKGKKLSADHRQKLSLSHKQYWEGLSDEERQKKLEAIPRDWSDESREKLSKTRTGRKSGRNTSSPYVGVMFYKRYAKWRAYIMVDKKQIHLGYFDTAEDAHQAYCEAEKEYRKKF